MIDPVKLLEEYQEQEESAQKKAALALIKEEFEYRVAPRGKRTYTCPSCGATITMFDHFCRECGQRLPKWEGWDV